MTPAVYFQFSFLHAATLETQFGWVEEFKSWCEPMEPLHCWTPPLSRTFSVRGYRAAPAQQTRLRRFGCAVGVRVHQEACWCFPTAAALGLARRCRGDLSKKTVTLRACSLACSSSSACCFSFSSMRLNDIPVEEREETALDRVDALRDAQERFETSVHFHKADSNRPRAN